MGATFIKNKLQGRKVVQVVDLSPKSQHLVLDDFLGLPVIFYRFLGVDPFETHEKTSVAFHLIFAYQLISVTIFLAMQLRLACLNEDIFETMEVLGYWTYGVGGLLKALSVQLQKAKMISLECQLRRCFPSASEEEQKQYDVKHYLRRYNFFAKGFGGLSMMLVTTYDLASIGMYVFQRWIIRATNPVQSMPYISLLPWEWRDSWRYYPTYLMQSISGCTATCSNISSDTMIFAVVMQVIMHFDRLARALREFEVRNNGEVGRANQDLRQLRSLIAYHNQILGLTEVMNEIFGIPLLLNFVTSSLLVCNVGFQLTMGFRLDHIGQQLLFITCALVEIYLICFFSQMLIDASEKVGYAAYDMNWLAADTRFRKMLVFLCLRAQKPVSLKATVFLNISIGTMGIFLKVSYQFFCAIRRMYN